jgi:hypothetical protein
MFKTLFPIAISVSNTARLEYDDELRVIKIVIQV